MSTVIEAFAEFFKESKYSYEIHDGCITSQFRINSNISNIDIIVYPYADTYTVFAKCPLLASESSRSAVSEYLMRANFNMISGCFEMNYLDGEVRFKVNQYCKDLLLSKENMKRSIMLPLAMFNRYGNGLLNVMVNGSSPEDEIRKAEKSLGRKE